MKQENQYKILFFLLVFTGCNSTEKPKKIAHKVGSEVKENIIVVNNRKVDVIQIKDGKVIGDILLLPGWNYSYRTWIDSSDFCKVALKHGYRLVLPDMGKSIYSTHYYPETRIDLSKEATLSWLTDTMIPYLVKNKIAFHTNKNYIYGVSTGARGALQIAIRTNSFFSAVAALSGDYNQVKLPNDNLITAFYGNYKAFSKRWEMEDNPYTNCIQIKSSLFLGHGLKDNLVSSFQTIELYNQIKALQPLLKVEIDTPEAGHYYPYWNSETKKILKFFQTN